MECVLGFDSLPLWLASHSELREQRLALEEGPALQGQPALVAVLCSVVYSQPSTKPDFVLRQCFSDFNVPGNCLPDLIKMRVVIP